MDLSVQGEEIANPITNTFASNHVQPPLLNHHCLPSNAPPPPPPHLPEEHHRHQNHQNSSSATTKKVVVVKYRECLKNHAASIGGNATDGCGEFMPSGEEGTIEALKCSACNCHRNFHRKEAEGDQEGYSGRQKGLLIPRAAPLHHWVMPLGALQSSESDHEVIMARPPSPLMSKKRFRTKFTAEQKDKMLSFAERAGWRMQKLEEGVVQQFCQEIGVKRRVFKVWMHNNKHSLAKKTNSVDHDQLE